MICIDLISSAVRDQIATIVERSARAPRRRVREADRMQNKRKTRPTALARHAVRLVTGVAMIGAGIGHLTFARQEFQAQVPDWVPLDKDTTVLASGVVEIGLGTALIAAPGRREGLGAILSAFLVAVFPGNVAQYTGHRDGLGLDSDRKRLVRLFFQPLMVAGVWWSTRRDRPTRP
jgi:uncharacterized membrane protein